MLGLEVLPGLDEFSAESMIGTPTPAGHGGRHLAQRGGGWVVIEKKTAAVSVLCGTLLLVALAAVLYFIFGG